MASDKKKNYSTEGLNSRQEVQDALASAGYQPSERVTEAEAALKAQQSAAPGNYQSRYQDQIDRTLVLGEEMPDPAQDALQENE